MASSYFSLISRELNTLMFNAEEHDEDRVKLKLYDLDIRFLEMFCLCLEAWDYTADEQENEISLRSIIITHLKRIWVTEDKLETWPKDIQDFDQLTLGLEGKIEQSKPQIERWCQILVRSSAWMQMQCKSSTHSKIFVNVYDLLIYRSVKKIPFNNQINILKAMLAFLSKLWSRVRECIDSKELVEYRNFVHAFSNNAACLTCLYWAKEANVEIAIEMNTTLFNMLHKIKPCAADITTCYFAVLKSNNLLQSVESRFEGQTLASFVDFFFAHTILKDDFLILRQRLIVLFTFLVDAPRKNPVEEDLIRSKTYTLLHEDAYFYPLPSDADFSNVQILPAEYRVNYT